MPKTINLDAAIREIVSDEVQSVLRPYKGILMRMATFLGQQPVRRGPGRPRKNDSGEPAARRAAGDGAARLAKKFNEGQQVQYRQGRGTFEAKVVEIDAEKGFLTLERVSDRKRVVRPASKVSPG